MAKSYPPNIYTIKEAQVLETCRYKKCEIIIKCEQVKNKISTSIRKNHAVKKKEV